MPSSERPGSWIPGVEKMSQKNLDFRFSMFNFNLCNESNPERNCFSPPGSRGSDKTGTKVVKLCTFENTVLRYGRYGRGATSSVHCGADKWLTLEARRCFSEVLGHLFPYLKLSHMNLISARCLAIASVSSPRTTSSKVFACSKLTFVHEPTAGSRHSVTSLYQRGAHRT